MRQCGSRPHRKQITQGAETSDVKGIPIFPQSCQLCGWPSCNPWSMAYRPHSLLFLGLVLQAINLRVVQAGTEVHVEWFHSRHPSLTHLLWPLKFKSWSLNPSVPYNWLHLEAGPLKISHYSGPNPFSLVTLQNTPGMGRYREKVTWSLVRRVHQQAKNSRCKENPPCWHFGLLSFALLALRECIFLYLPHPGCSILLWCPLQAKN